MYVYICSIYYKYAYSSSTHVSRGSATKFIIFEIKQSGEWQMPTSFDLSWEV